MNSQKPEETEKPPEETGFAPDDLTDGRKPGQWQTKYDDPIAKRAIRSETLYLCGWGAFSLAFLILIVLELPQCWLGLSGKTFQYFNLCIGAWLAGTLGGTLFAIKWLYHAVAKNLWNIDRRLWRFFTPHIGGVLALLVILIVSSGLFGFFEPDAVDKLPFVISLGFLTGYFSDSAAAKLADIATSIFGKIKERR